VTEGHTLDLNLLLLKRGGGRRLHFLRERMVYVYMDEEAEEGGMMAGQQTRGLLRPYIGRALPFGERVPNSKLDWGEKRARERMNWLMRIARGMSDLLLLWLSLPLRIWIRSYLIPHHYLELSTLLLLHRTC